MGFRFRELTEADLAQLAELSDRAYFDGAVKLFLEKNGFEALSDLGVRFARELGMLPDTVRDELELLATCGLGGEAGAKYARLMGIPERCSGRHSRVRRDVDLTFAAEPVSLEVAAARLEALREALGMLRAKGVKQVSLGQLHALSMMLAQTQEPRG